MRGRLDLAGQGLTTLDVSEPQPYVFVDVSGNPLADLGFLRWFPNVRELRARNCGISSFEALPEGACQKLTSLDLAENELHWLHDLPGSLGGLCALNLDGNPLEAGDERYFATGMPRLQRASFARTRLNGLAFLEALVRARRPLGSGGGLEVPA